MRLTSQSRAECLQQLTEAKERIKSGLLTDAEIILLRIIKACDTPEELRTSAMRSHNWLVALNSEFHALRELQNCLNNA